VTITYRNQLQRDYIAPQRMNAMDRACLRFTEIDYQIRHEFTALSSSGVLSVEWMRRAPLMNVHQVIVRRVIY
jgi:hypothetical protein